MIRKTGLWAFKRSSILLSLGFLMVIVTGCTGLPDKVTPVEPFQLQRYLGEWHEVARLDHSFERNLVEVTANYSLREDGGVRVINAGFNEKTQQAESVEGKAYFIGSDKVGRLKVSFFGPFYGSYNIAKLTPDYSISDRPITGLCLDIVAQPNARPGRMQRLFQNRRAAGDSAPAMDTTSILPIVTAEPFILALV